MGVCPVGAHKVTEHGHSFNRELCIGYGNLPWKRTYLLWKKVSADELLKDLKENGIHTAVDTCGFVPREAFEKVMPYTHIFLYGIKAISEDVHIKSTSQPN